jgi:hypothetical protein
VNTASEPVPVAGTVDARVTGTVGLAAGTSVGLAPGTSVGLAAGTSVMIGNPAGSPVPVREVGDGRQPIQARYNTGPAFMGCSFSNGYCAVDMFTVPAGRRLVIEQVSVNIQLFLGKHVVFAAVGEGLNGPGTIYLDPYDFLVPHNLAGTEVYHVNHRTLMFFEEGQIVRLQLALDSLDNNGGANVRFAGYLIPM